MIRCMKAAKTSAAQKAGKTQTARKNTAKELRKSTAKELQRKGGKAMKKKAKNKAVKKKANSPMKVQSSKKTPEQVVKVACLGDSNTTGKFSWASFLKKNLANKYKKLQIRHPKLGTCARCEVQGFGYSGAKAGDKMQNKMQYCRQAIFRKALVWQAHIYIIMLGTNDAHQSKGQPKHVEKALEALVAKICRDVSHAMVFFVLPPGANSKRCTQTMRNIVHPGVRRLGRKLKVAVVDARLWLSCFYKPDLIHLNRAGATKIASLAADVVSEMFQPAKSKQS